MTTPMRNYLLAPMSHIELATTHRLLLCSGKFLIVRQIQRHYSSLKDLSSAFIYSLFDKITVSRSSPYHIGYFMRFNTRNIFYKAPPALVGPAALRQFGFSAAQYAMLYHAESKLSSIRDEQDYRRRITQLSPYNFSDPVTGFF